MKIHFKACRKQCKTEQKQLHENTDPAVPARNQLQAKITLLNTDQLPSSHFNCSRAWCLWCAHPPETRFCENLAELNSGSLNLDKKDSFIFLFVDCYHLIEWIFPGTNSRQQRDSENIKARRLFLKLLHLTESWKCVLGSNEVSDRDICSMSS